MEKDTKELIVSIGAVAAVVCIIFGGLVAYSGMYPPFTVVNSGSMQHSEESQIGTIDAGDLMIVQSSDKSQIVTYVEGSQSGYGKFGEYGDVVVYDHPDRKVNIIHRAMVELELVSSDQFSQKWHIPSLKDYDNWEFRDLFGTDEKSLYWDSDECVLTIPAVSKFFEFTLTDVGYGHVDVSMPLWSLGEGQEEGYHGYLTKGDNASTNRVFDQNGIVDGLVTDDMVVSTAQVELPWLGCIKLMMNDNLSQNIPSNSLTNLIITFVVIIIAVFALAYGVGYLWDHRKSAKNDEKDENAYVRKSKQRK